MKKTAVVSFVLALFCAAAISAQSADKVTEMIKTDKATWGQVCYFSSTYLGLTGDNASYEKSMEALKSAGIIKTAPKNATTPIPLDQMAFIYAKTWKVGGSLWYKLFPTPRYAFKLLKADGIIPVTADPSKISTGHDALNIFNACMTKFSAPEGKK